MKRWLAVALAAGCSAVAFARDCRVTSEMSLDEVSRIDLAPGDRVLFQRGGVWRGTLRLKGGTAEKPVVYGAIGDGPAPMLTASFAASRPADWAPVGDGLWRLVPSVSPDVGAMWFDGEKSVGFKKDSREDVRNDLDFHCDRKTRTTLVKSGRNPAERFSSVELSLGVHGLEIRGADGLVVDGLHVRGAGNHGLSSGDATNVVIRNCTFDRIGGAELYVSEFGKHIRFGNAIEFWGNAVNVLVESNRFDQVYDAALTHQCSEMGQVQRNLTWRGNRVSRCEYSFEYWQHGEGAVTENVLVEGNVFEDAGYGFGHRQRWNPNAGHLILQDNTAATKNFVFRRNVFGRSLDRGIRLFNDWRGALRFEGNVWNLGPAKELCRCHGRSNVRAELKHLYPGYADCRHVDDLAEIEADSRSPKVYPNTPDGLARFRRDFGDAPGIESVPNAGETFADGARVTVNDAFWRPKFDLWRTNTVFDVLHKLDERSGALANFDRVARGEKGGHRGPHFLDGLYFEAIRGASDYLARNPSDELAQLVDGAVDRIVAAQRPDGYLHTGVQLGNAARQWGDNGGCALEQHELYNAGALVEAGVHHYRATGKTKLLAAAIRFANLLCDTIGPRPKRNLIPSHSLAEASLVKLARLLKDEPDLAAKAGAKGRPDDYLALVRFWFDAHGDNCGLPDWKPLIAHADNARVIVAMSKLTERSHDPGWRVSLWDYQMDAKPLAEYQSIEGHAVRAALLVYGLAAYGRETGDAETLALARRFWHSMTGRKMYLTGGVGAKADLERFADDFELPPDAYLETCAAVASAFTSAELFASTGDGKYMDELERVLYNALLTAVGENGRSYTYQNPLNTAKGDRWGWHPCPCCPPMFLKLTGALPGYVYSQNASGLSVNLFIGGGATLSVGGTAVRLEQRTRYPDDGRIEIAVAPAKPAKFALRVRVPGWARGVENHAGLYVCDSPRAWSLALNGEKVAPRLDDGYAVLEREWKQGDAVTLELDVSQRTVRADPRVAALKGLHAVLCGPVVMAEERGKLIPYWRVANAGPAPHRVWFSVSSGGDSTVNNKE